MFAPELSGLDRTAIHEWYNGYCWLGDEKVYNPFDILLLFRNSYPNREVREGVGIRSSGIKPLNR